ncbi:major histocompatibility complex class I-related gene protein-like [Megalobrama amblycephala]|uniref:major histocompatibility complex class I-related gene protein-like n=1 Tax=Megalobrama amblycephala TaxID=75352 RepID=UPI00201444FE|nr:major histocompatibility complex class I-related gene protein-like [Megalobrama amblycephala]
MKFIIFLIFIPLVYSELHTFMTTYTGISGQNFTGTPEFSAVTTLDGHQIDYYDSDIKKLIPKQDWMEEFATIDTWKEDTEIRKHVQQVYKNNIHVLMERFSHSHGVHTFQRMYGCNLDDETGETQGFDQYAYDGEDFISLDLKELRYITPVQQAELTVMKWNNDRTQLEFLKQYFGQDCVDWLNKFLRLSKATLEKADPPKVSLLQKNPDSPVECHVTGFLFRNTTISWKKNGQAMSDKLESRDTLPNEDRTFQRTVALYVHPDEWKKNQYTCVVEHKSLTETSQKILTEDEITRNRPGLYVPVSILVVALIVLYVIWKCRK